MWKSNLQCLSIHNIEVDAPLGVYASEKKERNKFLISVDLWGDYHHSMTSDRLEDTLDYQLIYDIAHEVMGEGGDLIEAAAQKIMKKIVLIDFPIQKVRVYIQKLNPPLQGKVSDTSFELILEREH